jgi:glycosyltransferase involved in cell wall biosynthesis
MKSTISVIIPFYRRQGTFGETLESVLQQTLQPAEIIVVDDASGDGAGEFLAQFVPSIKLITLEQNVGVSEARNIGVRAATGDYIAFLDSDDLWERDKLARQLDYILSHSDCDALHTGTKLCFPDGTEKIYGDKPARLQKSDLIGFSHLTCQSLIMRRADFLRLGGFDRSFRQTEDYEFSLRMVTNGLHVDFIPDLLVKINRGNTDHLSSSWWGFISGHIRVVWKYARVYQEVEGLYAPIKHTGTYLIKGGYKCGGIPGSLITLLGRCLNPRYKV